MKNKLIRQYDYTRDETHYRLDLPMLHAAVRMNGGRKKAHPGVRKMLAITILLRAAKELGVKLDEIRL